MRDAFARQMHALAQHDKRIVLLMGDIGNRMFDRFKADFPARFYNCGVAEANMVTMAAGMASCGLLPVCYTIAPFMTYRCMEQIRIDMCYQDLPVMIAGTGAGLSYASLGATHHSLEDVGMLRTLPNMRILCPCDALELESLLAHAFKKPQPTYLRIGKKGEPIFTQDKTLNPQSPTVFHSGDDVALLSLGNALPIAMQAFEALQAKGVSTELSSIHTIKPLPETYFEDLFKRVKQVILIEEHGAIGGLSSAVSEHLMKYPKPHLSVHSFNAKNAFSSKTVGNQNELRAYHGITAEAIMEAINV